MPSILLEEGLFQSTPSRRSSQPTHGRSQTMTTKLITANMEENVTLPKLTNTKGVAVSHDRIERFQTTFLEVWQIPQSFHRINNAYRQQTCRAVRFGKLSAAGISV